MIANVFNLNPPSSLANIYKPYWEYVIYDFDFPYVFFYFLLVAIGN